MSNIAKILFRNDWYVNNLILFHKPIVNRSRLSIEISSLIARFVEKVIIVESIYLYEVSSFLSLRQAEFFKVVIFGLKRIFIFH